MSDRLCSRCDVEMTLRPLYDGAEKQAWYCPCCKSSLRTVEMLQADWDADREQLGMTEAEYEAHMDAKVAKYVGKPTDADMAAAVRLAERMERDWTPACEHDDNPWEPAA